MKEQLLTLRRLYRFLILADENTAAPLPYLKRKAHFTQVDFWWGFFTAGIPEPAVKPWFFAGEGRPRALSNLMNRTVPHSLPLKLERVLEEHLTPEKVLHMTLWTASVLNHSIHAAVLHGAITHLEEQLHAAGDDWEFDTLYPFFAALRPRDGEENSLPIGGLFLQAVFRFTMLGLHAVYGSQMLSSPALTILRSCTLCDPKLLWQAARSTAPGLREREYSSVPSSGAERKGTAPGETALDQQLVESVTLSAQAALAQASSRLPCPGENAGWYVVANWMDTCVNLNDQPCSTYDGAQELGTVPNGQLLFVLSAPGYRGLHDNPGVWGQVLYQNQMGYVPMNLMVRLNIDNDPKKTLPNDAAES